MKNDFYCILHIWRHISQLGHDMKIIFQDNYNQVIINYFHDIKILQRLGKGHLICKTHLLLTLLLYFLFICYLPRYTLPNFPSISSQTSLPFLSCCHRTTTTKGVDRLHERLASLDIQGPY